MARTSLSLPHARRVAKLKAAKLDSRVKIAEHRERVQKINDELGAMKPAKKKDDSVI